MTSKYIPMRGLVAGGAIVASATIAAADITIRFVESAPKDRFVIENVGGCGTGEMEMVIDLSPAPAGLNFDTTASGAGVEVFQPFEVALGEDALKSAIAPSDGDQSVMLTLAGLAPGARFAFTVDVDDTGERSDLGQIRVSDAEIAGAEVRVNGETGVFDSAAEARIATLCSS